MPSELHIPITYLSNIHDHPNADNLAIAQVLGWQVILSKESLDPRKQVVYFAPDTMIPDDLAEEWGVKNYLHKGRVQSVRLRGEPSFGLCIPINEYLRGLEDATEYYESRGVKKWEPPTRHSSQSHRPFTPPPQNPAFWKYTHLANMRHYPSLFERNDVVVATEKIHGTNARIGMVRGELYVGSHRLERGTDDEIYNFPKNYRSIMDLLNVMKDRHGQFIIYGEIFGEGIQSLNYGTYRKFCAFDILVDGHFLDYPTFRYICNYHEIPMVPLLFEGQYGDFADMDNEWWATGDTRQWSGPDTIGLDGKARKRHMKEGFVIKPMIERSHPKIGRLALKYVSNDYLLSRQSDFKEE